MMKTVFISMFFGGILFLVGCQQDALELDQTDIIMENVSMTHKLTHPDHYVCSDADFDVAINGDEMSLSFQGEVFMLTAVDSPRGRAFKAEGQSGDILFSQLGDRTALRIQGKTYLRCQKQGAVAIADIDLSGLEGHEWVVEDLNGGGVIDFTRATLNFDGQTVSGSTSCNSYKASYEIRNGLLYVGLLATTRKACPPAIMAQEQKFISILSSPLSMQLDEKGILRLIGDRGSIRAL